MPLTSYEKAVLKTLLNKYDKSIIIAAMTKLLTGE